jgi:hypothetical protein
MSQHQAEGPCLHRVHNSTTFPWTSGRCGYRQILIIWTFRWSGRKRKSQSIGKKQYYPFHCGSRLLNYWIQFYEHKREWNLHEEISLISSSTPFSPLKTATPDWAINVSASVKGINSCFKTDAETSAMSWTWTREWNHSSRPSCLTCRSNKTIWNMHGMSVLLLDWTDKKFISWTSSY